MTWHYFVVMTWHYKLGVAYTICIYIDSGHPYEHPCYGQLTAVIKGIHQPMPPECDGGLNIVQLIEVLCFLKVVC